MFQIGVGPFRQPRQQKYIHNEYSGDSFIKFNPRPTRWLLLPTPSYFQRSMFIKCDTLTDAYFASLSFKKEYPENSIQYGIAKGAFNTTLSYDDINMSIISAYHMNMKLRIAMKKLMNKWKLSKMRIVNDVDIVTQELPLKPVYLRCWATKTIYQFEASTILRDSIIRLMTHDCLFLESTYPRNPFTNSELTYGACMSLHKQLRASGITHWLWEAYAASNFDVEILVKKYEVPMKLECLDSMLKDKKNYLTLDLVMDFILGEYAHHKTPAPTETAVLLSLSCTWANPTITSWIKLCKEFWTAEISHNSREKEDIHKKSREIMTKTRIWGSVTMFMCT